MIAICHNNIFSKMTNWQSKSATNYHSCHWVRYIHPVASIHFTARLWASMYGKTGLSWSLIILPLCRFHFERFHRTFSHDKFLSSQFQSKQLNVWLSSQRAKFEPPALRMTTPAGPRWDDLPCQDLLRRPLNLCPAMSQGESEQGRHNPLYRPETSVNYILLFLLSWRCP